MPGLIYKHKERPYLWFHDKGTGRSWGLNSEKDWVSMRGVDWPRRPWLDHAFNDSEWSPLFSETLTRW